MVLGDAYDRLRAQLGQPPQPSGPNPYMAIGGMEPGAWSAAADLLDPPEQRYLRDPVGWSRDTLGIELWSSERDIAEAVRDHHRVAVHSCHNVGKTLTAAVLALWWIAVHPVGQAFVVTTAPTHAQVAAVLWRELNRLHVRGSLGGRMNLLEWYFGNELVAMGRKPADYAGSSAFQGIHALYVLVVLDEACGIVAPIWDAASTLTSNDYSRMLAIGNPDDPHGKFSEVCTNPDKGWEKVIHVGDEHAPSFTGEVVHPDLAATLISRRWVAEKARDWGENSAIYTSKVKGLFPIESEFGVVKYADAMACRSVQLPEGEPVCAGLDVAEKGADKTVLRERRGLRAGRERVWAQTDDTMQLCAEVAQILVEWGVRRCVVDDIAVGAGVRDRLRELSSRHNPTGETTHAAEIVGFRASESARKPKQFLNKRAELWWDVGRERSRLRLWDLEAVDDDVIAELTQPRYVIVDSTGKVKVELKEETKARLRRSPDRADALLMAFWEGAPEATMPPQMDLLTGTNVLIDDERPGWAGPVGGRVS